MRGVRYSESLRSAGVSFVESANAARGGAAFALVHAHGEIDAGAVDLAPADAVRAADLESERGRRCIHGRLGVVYEPQRIDLRRVATRVHRNRADRIGA